MATFSLTREVTVDAAPERVRELLVDFRSWRTWSPWEDMDPDMQRTYSGPARGLGARYQWSGNAKAGEGEMEIVDVRPTRVAVGLTFHAPVPAENVITFELLPGQEVGRGTTRVACTMNGSRTAVMELFGRLYLDHALGKEFDRGLAALKAAAEASADQQ